jgi:tetraacyldisaccharide 4'-kinase
MRLYERIVSGHQKGLLATLARATLAFLALLYIGAYYLRRLFYGLHIIRKRRLPVPVISVGNLTLGGTGKTPFVMMLANRLKEKGVKVAVLSRGYGGRIDEAANDEAMMFAVEAPGIPLYVSPNRYKSGLKAVEEGAQVLILDDGFQHWRLKRDFDIVLVDAINPFGYGFIFPRGFLREPVSALRRADAIVLTHSDVPVPQMKKVMIEAIRRWAPKALFAEARHNPTKLVRIDKKEDERKPDFLKGKAVLGFCGLGNPLSFFVSLAQIGALIKAFFPLPDHFFYKARMIATLEALAKKLNCFCLVTTSKDAVKLAGFQFELPLFALGVELVLVKADSELFDRIFGVIAVMAKGVTFKEIN